MAIKIGINGFGRIGRLVFRAAMAQPDVYEIVGVNDPFMTPDYCAYMLKYDTVHGQYKGQVSHKESAIVVDGREVAFFAEKNPADIPWGKIGAEYIADATGIFYTKEKAQARKAKAAEKAPAAQ